MYVVFRTDASLDIGTGHVTRCLTLAEALREQGADCHFICREHPGNLLHEICQRGFKVHALPVGEHRAPRDDMQFPAYADWLGADWTTDAAQTKAEVGKTAVDWLIVDHYALGAPWETTLRPWVNRIMVIDDLADRAHDCDLLLDQNFGRQAEEYVNLVPAGCPQLIGPQYALLRPEFATLRSYSLTRRVDGTLNRLLISMGGVDKGNATGKVLSALRNCILPENLNVTVVMGPHAPWLAQVREQARQLPWATKVEINVRNMAQFMADSDLAIGAAGTTAWERCCLGLPTLVIVLADNQREGAAALEAAGCVVRLADDDTLDRTLPEGLAQLFDQAGTMQHAASQLTAGEGVAQVVSLLLGAWHG